MNVGVKKATFEVYSGEFSLLWVCQVAGNLR